MLVHVPAAPLYPGEPYPGEPYRALFVRVYKFRVERLVDTVLRLAQGERWTIHPPQGERTYRSAISG